VQLHIHQLRLLPLILAVSASAVPNDLFVDRAEELGVDFVHFAGVSGEYYIVEISGPGCGMLDYDNDGLLDLMTASGDVFVIEALVRKKDPFPMHQPNQLFRNIGSGKFEDVTARAGSVFELSEVSRGLAFGDIDNDGDTDVLLENCNGRARLLINTAGNTNHWLGLRLVAGTPPTDQIGAWVGVHRKGKPVKWRRVRTDGGFASANDPRLLFGLARDTTVDRVEVHWPDGSVESWTEIAVDRYTTLTKGGGEQAKNEDPKP